MLICLCWLTPGRGLGAQPDIRRDAVVEAVEKVLPSIVNISTETLVEVRDPLEELFRDFFGPYWGRPRAEQKSLGSGVMIDEAGYIVTNFHVVQRATRITVTLADGREFEARALSRTAGSDVALLQIVKPGLETFQAIRLAADDDLLLGETVLALGNPFGLGVSVSRGILSSKTRRPPVEDQPLEMEDWLQTDAAINPGNSGGPLVNLKGELIGLNVAILRQGQGIGFAIPVKRISEAIGEMFTPERIRSLWFGARFRPAPGGVTAGWVEPESPADRAGLREGDIVLQVNGRAPLGLVDLSRELVAIGDDRELRLRVLRGQEHRQLTVRLIPEAEVFNAALIRHKMGLTVEDVTAKVAAQMRLSSPEGLVITAVEKNSPGARANLARGDVLRAIDGRPVENIKGAARMLHGRKAGEVVDLSLVVSRPRGGFLAVYAARAKVSLR